MSLYYPIMLKIKGKPCSVVGGGEVAERKVIKLLEHEAIVTVISPKLTDLLRKLAEEGKITYKEKYYETGDLSGSYVVYAVTDDIIVNRKCKEEAAGNHILINVGDSEELSDFTVPASIKRGSLIITVSTEGKSPMLSRKIKEEIGSLYGEEYGEVVDLLGEIRKKALKEISCINNRKKLFQQLVEDLSYEIDSLDKENAIKEKMWNTYRKFKKT